MIYRNGISTNIPFWYILKKNQVKMTMPGRQGEGWRLERRWFCGLLRRNKFRIACSGFCFFLNEKPKVRSLHCSSSSQKALLRKSFREPCFSSFVSLVPAFIFSVSFFPLQKVEKHIQTLEVYEQTSWGLTLPNTKDIMRV